MCFSDFPQAALPHNFISDTNKMFIYLNNSFDQGATPFQFRCLTLGVEWKSLASFNT